MSDPVCCSLSELLNTHTHILYTCLHVHCTITQFVYVHVLLYICLVCLYIYIYIYKQCTVVDSPKRLMVRAEAFLSFRIPVSAATYTVERNICTTQIQTITHCILYNIMGSCSELVEKGVTPSVCSQYMYVSLIHVYTHIMY